MKKTFATLVLLFTIAFGWSQDLKGRIASLDSIGHVQFNTKEYDSALSTFNQMLDLVKKEYGANDSLYANTLATISRCYFRQKAHKKALEYGLEAAEIYGSNYNRQNTYYANLLDNNALYYSCIKDFQTAEKVSDEALQIYYKYFTNDKEMASVLAHAAEIKYCLDKYKEAVALQEHALTLIESDEGVHSSHYLSELNYMKMYYDKVDNKTKVAEMDSLKTRLTEEIEHGYVPPLIDFNSDEKCRQHNLDVYYCSIYYLNHYLNAPKMGEACQYIITWSMASPDISVYFGEAESKWLTGKVRYPLMAAYLAGNIKYYFTNYVKDPFEQYGNGIVALVNFYSNNKQIFGEIEALEEYISIYKKGNEHLNDRLMKDYKGISKEEKKGNFTSSRPDNPQ